MREAAGTNEHVQPVYELQIGARTNKNTAKWTEGLEDFPATWSGVLDSRERNGFAEHHSFLDAISAAGGRGYLRLANPRPSCCAKLSKGRVGTRILVEFAPNRPLRHFV